MDIILTYGIDDRQYEEEDKKASKKFTDNLENDISNMEPECTKSTEDDDIECEFEKRDGGWWCSTHNCHA